MAELLVPLAFWNHVPAHNWFSYTCVLISPDKKKIVTGTASGRICIWEINNIIDTQTQKNEQHSEKNGKEDSSGIRIAEDETEKLILRTVLLGHKSPIVALTSAVCDSEPCIVSVSQDGTICIWSYIDGHCIGASERLLKCLPTSVVTMPKGHHIACAGHSTFIEIVNLRKLKVTLTLSAHQHWITSLYATNLGVAYNPLLISAGTEGVIQFWSVKKGESDVPLQTLVLEIEEPLSVQLSPNSKTILIVTSEEWLLCTAKAGQELCHVKCPEVGGWKGGVFFSNHICIVWSKAGNAYLYSLPRVQAQPLHFASASSQSNSDPSTPVGSPGSFSKSFMSNFQSVSEEEDEKIEAPKQVPANNFRASFLGKLNIKDPHGENPPICIYCTNNSNEPYQVLNDHSGAAVPGVVVTANRQGKFHVWLTPSRFPEKVTTPERILPWAASHPEVPKEAPAPAVTVPVKDHHHFSGGFNLRASYGSMVANVAAPQSSTPPVVTSSIVIEQLLLLVQGYNNGCMSICTLPTSESAKPKFHQAHAAGTAVTALLSHIDGQLCRIVSGGEDFAVVIWNLKDNSYLQPLVRFSVHSGPVIKLFSPPSYSLPSDDSNSLQSKWKNRFFSISKDKTIALFSFSNVAWEHTYGVHPAPIIDIKWQLDQDLLMVESEDGSVSLWEMSNAQLEGVYNGEMARDIMRVSSTLLPHYDSDFTLHQKAVSGFTVSSFHDPFPIQLLFINVKKLLSDLDKALRPSGIKAKGRKSRHQRSKSVSEAPPSTPSTPANNNNNNPPPSPGTPSMLFQNATTNLRNLAKGASFANLSPNREGLSVSSGSIPKSVSQEHIVDPVITSPPTHLHAYLMLTYFLPWGLDAEMDKAFREKLGLFPPNPQHCFAIRGYGGKMTVLVPPGASKAYTQSSQSITASNSTSAPNFVSNTFDRWKRSPFLSALHTLSAAALAHNLLGIDYFEDICNTLCSHYFSTIPDRVSNYVHPSLSFFAGFWQDPSEDVMQSARAALAATADRLPEDERKQFAKTWFNKFKDSHESKSLSLLVLGIFGSKYPGSMDTEIALQVTEELLKLLQAEREASSLRVAAAELLGKGFKTWRPYIKDIDALIQQLFAISLLQEPHNISTTAHHALMMIGSAEPKQFVLSLGKYILEVHHNDVSGKAPNVSQHSAAMMTLGSLIKQDPISLLDLLPRVVETVVRSLDPHIPFLRDSCLVATTKVIHVLVEKYPMIGFHQETQRLAVGTKEALIVIYDLKTATRWHVLEGHSGPISAVSFSENGKMFASYSLQDAEVRLWQTTTAFLGLLGSNPHCVRTFKVNKVEKQLTPISTLECIRLKWTNEKAVVLQRSWEGSLTLKL